MSSQRTSSRHSPLLIATGICALLWLVARAAVQSLTIDEADTYLAWVWPEGPAHWYASANNHVLNSMLMKLVTEIFGASTFTLRLPALIGAALYLAAAYCLARLLTEGRLLQWSVFVCLTCSPLVMDYLVAARGYSLASAFLLWMIALGARWVSRDADGRLAQLLRTCVLISLCGALSVSANFSFAVADAATGLALYLWMCREQRRDYLKMLAYFTLPGLAAAYLFVGSVVRAWPKGQLTWGARSLFEMVKSLVNAALFEPNGYLLHPQLQHYFIHFGRFLYPALAVLVLWRLAMLAMERRMSPPAVVCGFAMVLALLAHEFLFQVYGILLPLDRTALWLAILFLVMAAAVTGVTLSSRAGRLSGKALAIILAAIACYNIGCLRLTYFNEWKYDADLKNVYSVLASYKGITKVSANWRYMAVLNCYRVLSGNGTMEQIPVAPGTVNDYPAGYQAYVVYYPWDEGFCKREGLKVVYQNSFSGVAVAVRPEVE